MTWTTSGSRSTRPWRRTRPGITSQASEKRRRAARPLVGPGRAGARPRARPAGRAGTVRPAVRRAQGPRRHAAGQAAGRRPEGRRHLRPAAGRRAARHRRAQARAAAGGDPAGAAEPAVLRPDPVAVEVDLDLPRLPRRERPPGPRGRRRGGGAVLVGPGGRGRRDDLAGRPRGLRLLPAGGRLHPHRLAQQAGRRPGDRPVARGRPGGGALAAAHLPGRRHAAARPLADRPRRPDRHRREVAGPGLARLQRARRRGRRDHRPAPGGGADRPVRPGVGGPRRRARVRDQGHLAGDDAPVLLAPRVDHRRPARPRGAVRAAVRPRAVAAGAGAARAGVELRHAQGARKARWTSRSCTRAGRTSSRARSASRSRRSPRRSGTQTAQPRRRADARRTRCRTSSS